MRYRFPLILILLAAALVLNFSCASAPKKTTGPGAADRIKIEEKTPPPEETPPETATALNQVNSRNEEDKSGLPETLEGPSQTEEVYALIQEAQAALEVGELDRALTLLDQAYSVLLRIEAPPDSDLYQVKNDLRIMLVQKIQQVYAFRLLPPISNHKTIPLVENKWVQAEIKSFQTVERRFFEEAYRRSGQYWPMIVEELKKAGLPEELSWLPLIESGFKPRALSRSRALGLWQFIASTGYRYGLKRDKFIDERMDPVKATRAAIKYLQELHDFFGDWTTAIAAYNCGEIRVQNVIRAQKIDYLDNFWDLFANLPYETARYVPRFIATLMIIDNPEKYGFSLPEPEPALDYETVTLQKPVKLSVLASKLGLGQDQLVQLNPELRHDSTPDYQYQLRVPAGWAEPTLAGLNELPNWMPPEAVFGWHTVRKGETLGLIARRYRTTIQAIVRLNNLKISRLIYPGQRLKIPGRAQGLTPAEDDGGPVTVASGQVSTPDQAIVYVVKAGDTLYQISRNFGVSVDRIKRDNKLSDDNLVPGQKLIIKNN
ncbi:MAG: LysM peptidoglycan-binding domain-containing protein [Candidatus Saccharicenans sp.]|jgi:membrane-bound lytic murein transglycosylase D|nr:LysM peptidoglycan-binding domain-containing protein [Candidatus Saccharicenans sp.]